MKFKKGDKIEKKGEVVKHESAGGFLFYDSKKEGLLVALLKKIDDEYYMPKGHLHENETPEKAANREVVEELCLKSEPKLLGKVCTDNYSFTLPNDTRQHFKIVHIYVFCADEKLEIAPLEDENFEVAKWVSIDKAMKILVFDGKNLRKAEEKYLELKK